jgi:hypothetical protein
MNILKRIPCFFIAFIIFQYASAQDYGPKPIKPYDVKLIKGKVLLIPEYDDKAGFVKIFIPKEAFKEFKTEKEINNEYKKRWDSAMKISSFDLIASYEIKWFDKGKLDKENDKMYMTLNFEADFYNNWYAFLTVFDPKTTVVATAPVNGLDFSKIDDIKLMMNMLAYSMIKGSSFYGDDAKSLYRDHQFRYKKAMEVFSDSIRNRVFLLTRFDKDKKNYKKYNDNLNEALKLSWKISNFDFLLDNEVKKRVAEKRLNDYYLKSIPIYTSNSLMVYNYWLVLTASNNDVIYTNMGSTFLNSKNLKFFQIDIEKWLYYFMTKRTRDKYKMVASTKENAATTTNQPSKPIKIKTAPPPEEEKPKKAAKSKPVPVKASETKAPDSTKSKKSKK